MMQKKIFVSDFWNNAVFKLKFTLDGHLCTVAEPWKATVELAKSKDHFDLAVIGIGGRQDFRAEEILKALIQRKIPIIGMSTFYDYQKKFLDLGKQYGGNVIACSKGPEVVNFAIEFLKKLESTKLAA